MAKPKKASKGLPMMPPPLPASDQPMPDLANGGPNQGVDAVSQPGPMVSPQPSMQMIPDQYEQSPDKYHNEQALGQLNPYPSDLQRFGNQALQPDRVPIMNALGMLHSIGNTFLPPSQLSAAEGGMAGGGQQQAPGLWQRPPIGPSQSEMLTNQPVQNLTADMTPPSLPNTNPSMTQVEPRSMSMGGDSTMGGLTEPLPGMSPTQTMQAPQQPPSPMQQGNSQMLQMFNNMTPQQQLQVLTAALGLGAGAGFGYEASASGGQEQQMQPPQGPQQQWYGEALPPPKATQR